MAKLDVPVCRACPTCGSPVAKKIGSRRLLSASGDRQCSSCGTRYTPPTSRWVSIGFIAFGLLLAGPTVPATVGLVMQKFGGGVEVVQEQDAWINTPSAWAVLACSAVTALIGLLSLLQGWQMLREKVIEPPKPTKRSSGQI
ncbi:MAG: hypothetical protein AAGC44_06910 [Planctomycetota bacterium]